MRPKQQEVNEQNNMPPPLQVQNQQRQLSPTPGSGTPTLSKPHEIDVEQKYNNGPTVWLCNDNAGTIFKDQNRDLNLYIVEEVNHWQAMTPEPNARARSTVDRWNLEDQTRALVDRGLAMVRRTVNVDHEGTLQKIYAGCFVTIDPTTPDTPTSGTAVVDIGDQYGEMAVSNLKVLSYSLNIDLPTEPPKYKPGVPNFRIFMVNKPPPRSSSSSRGKSSYPIINNFKISRSEMFHALPGSTPDRPKVRKIEEGETGEIDNREGFMGGFTRPWGLEGKQRFVAYPGGIALPLAKLVSAIEGTEFEVGEIVLVTGRGKGADGNHGYHVRDIDGDVGFARDEQMGRRVMEAFGLKFAGAELENKLKMLTAKGGGGQKEKKEEGKNSGKVKVKGKKAGKRKADEEVPVPKISKKTKKTEVAEASSKQDGKIKADENVPQLGPSKKETKISDKRGGKRKADEDLPPPKENKKAKAKK
ncbi:hypothetical protein BKA64DRAFT_399064 [Cadophora sp. MPI-SDFR-AT-0126]|nr:hypothetical protein BKA64DRAFT_399064 [Leotiomycetes sp. MPI-SDFR-AT-0126]